MSAASKFLGFSKIINCFRNMLRTIPLLNVGLFLILPGYATSRSHLVINASKIHSGRESWTGVSDLSFRSTAKVFSDTFSLVVQVMDDSVVIGGNVEEQDRIVLHIGDDSLFRYKQDLIEYAFHVSEIHGEKPSCYDSALYQSVQSEFLDEYTVSEYSVANGTIVNSGTGNQLRSFCSFNKTNKGFQVEIKLPLQGLFPVAYNRIKLIRYRVDVIDTDNIHQHDSSKTVLSSVPLKDAGILSEYPSLKAGVSIELDSLFFTAGRKSSDKSRKYFGFYIPEENKYRYYNIDIKIISADYDNSCWPCEFHLPVLDSAPWRPDIFECGSIRVIDGNIIHNRKSGTVEVVDGIPEARYCSSDSILAIITYETFGGRRCGACAVPWPGRYILTLGKPDHTIVQDFIYTPGCAQEPYVSEPKFEGQELQEFWHTFDFQEGADFRIVFDPKKPQKGFYDPDVKYRDSIAAYFKKFIITENGRRLKFPGGEIPVHSFFSIDSARHFEVKRIIKSEASRLIIGIVSTEYQYSHMDECIEPEIKHFAYIWIDSSNHFYQAISIPIRDCFDSPNLMQCGKIRINDNLSVVRYIKNGKCHEMDISNKPPFDGVFKAVAEKVDPDSNFFFKSNFFRSENRLSEQWNAAYSSLMRKDKKPLLKDQRLWLKNRKKRCKNNLLSKYYRCLEEENSKRISSLKSKVKTP